MSSGLALAAAMSWCAMLALALRRLRSLGLLERVATAPCGGFAASARRVLRVGLPAAATNAIIPVATTLYTAMLAAHGAVAVAGFSVGSRIEALSMVAFFALSAVANPFAAQNAGAGRMDRVREGMRAALALLRRFGCRARPAALPSCRPSCRGFSPPIRRWPLRPRSTFR